MESERNTAWERTGNGIQYGEEQEMKYSMGKNRTWNKAWERTGNEIQHGERTGNGIKQGKG